MKASDVRARTASDFGLDYSDALGVACWRGKLTEVIAGEAEGDGGLEENSGIKSLTQTRFRSRSLSSLSVPTGTA